jgi:hypothetical protein
MFALYGARVAMTGGAKMSADDYLWLAEHNGGSIRRPITLTGDDVGETEASIIAGTGAWGDGVGSQGGQGPCL